MLNQRLAAAQKVANELFPAEQKLEEAIVHNARLVIATVEGRATAKLPITVGQEALDFVAQANVRLCEARGLLAQAHLSFRETQEEIGLRAVGFGDEQSCPSSGELRVVSPVAAVA